jgi:type I restriction enzyme S subunit
MGEYKDTHLGKIPIDWNVTELQYVTNDKDRYSFAGGPFGSDLKSEHYTEDGIRVIQLQNIGDGEFLNSSKVYTSLEKADELVKCNIYPGDIILAKMAEPVARACKIPDIEDRFLMCSDGIRVSVDSNKFDADYITYSINADYFRNVAISRSTGSTRLRIGLGALKTIELLIPPLPEQKKIAKILSTVDGHIDEVDGMIEDLKELKKGLMQKLLTEGIGHIAFKDSEVGRIPVEWELRKLNDITDVRDGTHDSPKQLDSGVPFVTSKNLKSYGLDFTEISYISEMDHQEISRRSHVEKGDILFGMIGTIGNPVIVDIDFEISIKNVALIKFAKSDYDDRLLKYLLDSELVLQQFRRKSNGGVQKFIALGMIRDLDIPVPSKSEQIEIARILSSVDERIDLYMTEYNNLLELKKGLMQQLLTGKVRVC